MMKTEHRAPADKLEEAELSELLLEIGAFPLATQACFPVPPSFGASPMEDAKTPGASLQRAECLLPVFAPAPCPRQWDKRAMSNKACVHIRSSYHIFFTPCEHMP
ncbi:hypothetical protein P7K49_027836 [Saguinus oedipus]|uniref:Uncharacterized protein n=1 Tax=Saguinus oedipus TaxID=9490 RepID=A0ABQ9UAK5_SAGOE|nr:hypothetical protein P7K49_027836 [Saguinus oedipus]